jgi:hypothetical protein
MSALYDRHETDEQIEFVFHFMPLASVLFALLVIASLAPGGNCTNKIRPVCGILLLLWVVGLLPAWIELEEAMKAGRVSVSGSKLSFERPLRVTIIKKAAGQ